MKEITGTTRIFPVIGWPVEQVKAPTLFNAYFKRHGLDARGGTAEEVANAILWLLSDESSYATGTFIDVSGGR